MTKARQTNLFFLGMLVCYMITCFLIIPLIPAERLGANAGVIIGESIVVFAMIIFLLFTKGAPLKNIKFKRIGVLNTFLLVIFAYCMIPVVGLINSISMLFTPNVVTAQINGMSTNSFAFNIFLVAVVPAVVEEFAFRGFIFGGYRNSVMKRAILMSALAFGLYHMNLNQFCYALIMGIVFAIIREGTGSLHSSMIVHFIFNSNSIVMTEFLKIYTNYMNRMAENNEEFREIADSLKESSDSTVSYADYPLSQKLASIVMFAFLAAIAGTIAFFILRTIIKRCHRYRHIKIILASMIGRKIESNGYYLSDEYIEENNEEYGGRIIDFVSVLAIIICILMMMT